MTFQSGINHRKWQLTLIPLVSFIVACIISYSSIKDDASYFFSWKLMVMIAIFTFVIWEVNIVTYKLLDKTNAFFENPGKRLLVQIVYSVTATWVTYAFLYNIIYLVKGGNYSTFPVKDFFLFFLVSTTIALVINSLYVIRYLQSTVAYKEVISTAKMNELLHILSNQSSKPILVAGPEKEPVLDRPKDNNNFLLINSGSKMQQIPFSNMAYWYSSEGLVILVLANGKKITTNFSSYSEFIGLLPENQFFQLNRQFVAHIQSILSIKDDVNRKLVVELKAPLSESKIELVTVSRYRSQQLKEWFVALTK